MVRTIGRDAPADPQAGVVADNMGLLSSVTDFGTGLSPGCPGPMMHHVPPSPAAVQPGRPGMPLRPNIGDRIDPGRSKTVAAAQPRGRQPKAPPRAIRVNRLQGVLRTRRQVPAMPADERLEGIAINVNRKLQAQRQQPPSPLNGGVADIVCHCAATDGSAPDRRASISVNARSTASNTSKVEACRAL